jgi:hypothetical protein
VFNSQRSICAAFDYAVDSVNLEMGKLEANKFLLFVSGHTKGNCGVKRPEMYIRKKGDVELKGFTPKLLRIPAPVSTLTRNKDMFDVISLLKETAIV